MKYRLDKEIVLDDNVIRKLVDLDQSENARKIKLHDYYKGKHKILQRQYEDPTKPNNKVVNPYARYITTLMTGYFMGEPVGYTSDDEQNLEKLMLNFEYNDEPSVNKQLAQNQSIFGVAYEIMYVDSDGIVRFKALPSEGMMVIYDNTLEDNILYGIRYWTEKDILTNNDVNYIEVYDSAEVRRYKQNRGATLQLIDQKPHNFPDVPINVYYNNEEVQGDFELVISEIDAYDSFESDSVNEADYFADTYLMLSGMEGTESEDVADMKSMRCLIMPEGGSAAWLTKSVNDTWIENEKKRLDADIHKFSFCPAMTDENFAQNASGVAMRYKLLGLETAVGVKETEFEKGLRRRIELISGMLSKTDSLYSYLNVNIVFTRNLPQDLASAVDTVSKLDGIISDETRLSLLPLDIDVSSELEKVEEAKANAYALFTVGGDEDEAEE